MKTLLLAGATLALLTAVNFSPAMAQEPKLSGGNTWAGISQRVDTSGRCRQNGTAGRGSPGGRSAAPGLWELTRARVSSVGPLCGARFGECRVSPITAG
jgi:hypothetical protein